MLEIEGKILDPKLAKLSKEELLKHNQKFLKNGNIENLIWEGRTPVLVGLVSDGDNCWNHYYQVPPKDFNERNLDNIENINSCYTGCYTFEFKDGRKEIGETYVLSVEEGKTVEQRIIQEKERRRIRRKKIEKEFRKSDEFRTQFAKEQEKAERIDPEE